MLSPNQNPQSTLEGMSHYSPEIVLENFKSKRIVADAAFTGIYSEYNNDMQRTHSLHTAHQEKMDGREMLGFAAEALIFTCIEKGALGNTISARGTSDYDDLFHGADMVIESTAKQLRDPIVSTVDVTINQNNIQSNVMRPRVPGKMEVKLGLDKKLERVVRHINLLANMSDNEAVALSAWLQSGGLSGVRNNSNDNKFRRAEELMLLKYYKNPKNGDHPDEPHFVLSGPQVVLSVDTLFVNKVFSTTSNEIVHKKAIENLSNILQVEVPLFVIELNAFVEKVADNYGKRGKGTNLFFAQYRAACRAWQETFDAPDYQARVTQALKVCMSDKDSGTQVREFAKTLEKSFGVRV